MTETKRYAGLGMVAALALGLCLLAPAKPAPAMSTADQPSAILVWPSIHVNLAKGIDTRLQLVNHSSVPKLAHCFYEDATNWCRMTDFFITLTSNQPISWLASEGLRGPILNKTGSVGVCAPPAAGVPCVNNSFCQCIFGENNNGTAVPPVSEYFEGALKCVQFDPGENGGGGPRPDTENSLTGMAAILRGQPQAQAVDLVVSTDAVMGGHGPDDQKYSAIGLKSIADHEDNRLQLGGDGAEYQGCPSTLIVNHLFDDATNPLEIVPGGNVLDNRTVHTFLALIPCSEDFLTGEVGPVTAQYLVFNEFEQRFSTSTPVDCVVEKKLSAIDTGGYNTDRSIWSAFVSGTIVGQTRIQGVGSERGLLGVARLMNGWYESFADYNIHQQGDKSDGDTLVIP